MQSGPLAHTGETPGIPAQEKLRNQLDQARQRLEEVMRGCTVASE